MNQFKRTKKAEQVLAMVNQFVNDFQRCKRRPCEVVHLSKDQLEALGVQSGYNYLGVKLESYQ